MGPRGLMRAWDAQPSIPGGAEEDGEPAASGDAGGVHGLDVSGGRGDGELSSVHSHRQSLSSLLEYHT